MLQAKQLLASRRGSVALESALAVIPLVFCLAGMIEIVQTIFTSDLVQRAAHRAARTTVLAGTAANSAALENRVRQAVSAEVGNMLNYDLTMSGTCTPPASATYCMSVSVDVYDDPSDLKNGTLSTGSNAALGGDGGDMVVVRVHLQPQSVLSLTQQWLLSAGGLRSTVVMRNEP